ncbi:hypothetical protein STEG23_022613 [Scotinomys teguina]
MSLKGRQLQFILFYLEKLDTESKINGGKRCPHAMVDLNAAIQLLVELVFSGFCTQSSTGGHDNPRQGVSEEPPPTHTFLKKKQVKQKAESLTTQLQIMTSQWNELRNHLIIGTEGSLDYRTRPYHRPSCFYEKVKMEHKQVMSDLQQLKNDNRDASEMFRELTEEKGFY